MLTHLDTSLIVEEALWSALLGGNKLPVDSIDVRCQESGRMGISTGDHNCGGAAHISSQACSHEGADVVRDWDQDLTTQVSALLLRGELVLKVDTCRIAKRISPEQVLSRAIEATMLSKRKNAPQTR